MSLQTRNIRKFLGGMLLCGFVLNPLFAEEETEGRELYTNGWGGGPWSDTSTWFDGELPGPGDTVVISRGDTLQFDLAEDPEDPYRIHADALFVEPRAVLEFRQRSGALHLRLGGEIQLAGAIRIIGAATASDSMTLQVGASGGSPEIRILPTGQILTNGHRRPSGGIPNVHFVAKSVAMEKLLAARDEARRNLEVHRRETDAEVRETEEWQERKESLERDASRNQSGFNSLAGRMEPVQILLHERGFLDFQYTRLTNLHFRASRIDSSGGSNDQRLQLRGCLVDGLSRFNLSYCDGVEISDTIFRVRYEGHADTRFNLFEVSRGRNLTLRNCRFIGRYNRGLRISHAVEPTLVNARFEGTSGPLELRWVRDAVFRNIGFEDNSTAISARATSFQFDGGYAINTGQPFRIWGGRGSGTQIAHFVNLGFVDRIAELEEEIAEVVEEWEADVERRREAGEEVDEDESAPVGEKEERLAALREREENRISVRMDSNNPLNLLNVNFGEDQIRRSESNRVTSYYFVILGSEEGTEVPLQSLATVETLEPPQELAEGATDMNIRNNPVMFLPQGVTPPPSTLRSLTVRGWTIEQGEKIAAPLYRVTVQSPSGEGALTEFATKTFRPDETLFIANQSTLEPNLLFSPAETP